MSGLGRVLSDTHVMERKSNIAMRGWGRGIMPKTFEAKLRPVMRVSCLVTT